MANSFDSNFTRKVARVFLEKFESERVLTKNVNTQLVQGKFNPSSGANVDVKRPTDFISVRTAGGDVSGSNPSDIIVGKATATVQNYFTAFVDYDEADEAIKMDQLDQLLAPLATRIKTDMETDFGSFMLKHSGLYAGTMGQAAVTWDEVAEATAVMQAVGVPMDKTWCYAANPFTTVGLASNTRGIGAGGAAGNMIKTAHDRAILTDNFAGLRVMTCTTLPSYTTQAGADRAGTVNGTMDVTYATHKDTMLQTITVTAFQANLVVKAGERITIAGVNLVNQSTRQAVLDENGASVPWVGVVAADVTLGSSGEGNITVYNPAIYEASGAHNTVTAAIGNGAVVTLLGSASTTYQPNLFWHRDAFCMASVPIKKLYSTDTLATTEDGLQFRVSKYADGDANKQTVRFDFRPAYGALNEYFAGHGWGVS
jgi:hypothetical protein